MFNKMKEVVEYSMNALAPPPPLHDDFVYQWKRFMKNYISLSSECKTTVEHTKLPICLDLLRNILINEDEEMIRENDSIDIGPCMEYLLKNNLLDLLVSIAILGEPPGIKSCILQFFSKTLTQLKAPNLAHSAIYTPLMKMMNVCDGLLHTVSEDKEIDFLLHLSALLRKQPGIAVMFFSNESTKYLTEVSETGDTIQYKGIVDLALTYVDSADCNVRVKACQCILLLCSVEDQTIARGIVDDLKFNHFLIGRLTTLFYGIPPCDCDQFKNIKASWTLDILSNFQKDCLKNREAIVFFGWLDFLNQLSFECHPLIQNHLRECVTENFLKEVFDSKYLPFPKTIALFHKYYSSITSPVLLSGFREWLISSDCLAEVPDISTNATMRTLIDNCFIDDEFVASTSLNFFSEMLSKCEEQVIQYLILCYLKERLYFDASSVAFSWSDEEDERQKYSSSPEASSCSRTLAPSTIDKIINSFTNLIPPPLRSQQNEENIKILQSQFQEILRNCSKFNWPTEATSDVETLSNDSNPEADNQKRFYEGPFLNLIFQKIKNLPILDHSQVASIISIISKLAILPNPYLHEYFLNPSLPLRKGVPSLYSSLQYVTNDVISMVQVVVNYQNELKLAREKLADGDKDMLNSKNKIDRYLVICVLLEDLCDELAAIAYVKYAYFH